MIIYDYIWLYMTIFDYIWLYMIILTIYDYICASVGIIIFHQLLRMFRPNKGSSSTGNNHPKAMFWYFSTMSGISIPEIPEIDMPNIYWWYWCSIPGLYIYISSLAVFSHFRFLVWYISWNWWPMKAWSADEALFLHALNMWTYGSAMCYQQTHKLGGV